MFVLFRLAVTGIRLQLLRRRDGGRGGRGESLEMPLLVFAAPAIVHADVWVLALTLVVVQALAPVMARLQELTFLVPLLAGPRRGRHRV